MTSPLDFVYASESASTSDLSFDLRKSTSVQRSMRSHWFSLCAIALAALATLVQGHAIVGLEAHGYHNSSHKSPPKLGAVASESAVCSRIGTDLIEKGGNAADAVSSQSLWASQRLNHV